MGGHSAAETSYLSCAPGLLKVWRKTLGPSPAPDSVGQARTGISTLVPVEMATEGPLNGLIPETERKGGELSLDSCLLQERGLSLPQTFCSYLPCLRQAAGARCSLATHTHNLKRPLNTLGLRQRYWPGQRGPGPGLTS